MAEADPGSMSKIAPIDEKIVANAAELDRLLRAADRPFVVRGLAWWGGQGNG